MENRLNANTLMIEVRVAAAAAAASPAAAGAVHSDALQEDGMLWRFDQVSDYDRMQ